MSKYVDYNSMYKRHWVEHLEFKTVRKLAHQPFMLVFSLSCLTETFPWESNSGSLKQHGPWKAHPAPWECNTSWRAVQGSGRGQFYLFYLFFGLFCYHWLVRVEKKLEILKASFNVGKKEAYCLLSFAMSKGELRKVSTHHWTFRWNEKRGQICHASCKKKKTGMLVFYYHLPSTLFLVITI